MSLTWRPHSFVLYRLWRRRCLLLSRRVWPRKWRSEEYYELAQSLKTVTRPESVSIHFTINYHPIDRFYFTRSANHWTRWWYHHSKHAHLSTLYGCTRILFPRPPHYQLLGCYNKAVFFRQPCCQLQFPLTLIDDLISHSLKQAWH